jgi:hypothetical protein
MYYGYRLYIRNYHVWQCLDSYYPITNPMSRDDHWAVDQHWRRWEDWMITVYSQAIGYPFVANIAIVHITLFLIQIIYIFNLYLDINGLFYYFPQLCQTVWGYLRVPKSLGNSIPWTTTMTGDGEHPIKKCDDLGMVYAGLPIGSGEILQLSPCFVWWSKQQDSINSSFDIIKSILLDPHPSDRVYTMLSIWYPLSYKFSKFMVYMNMGW